MSKWTAVKVKQELVDQVEKKVAESKHKGLSEFVSEAIQLRLQTLAEKRIPNSLRSPRVVGMREYPCTNGFVHNIKVVRYDDSSIWVTCPMFGWFEEPGLETPKLGCKERKKRCTWFIG